MQARTVTSSFRPCIVMGGVIYPLAGSSVVGRWHSGCPSSECMSKGFRQPPQIPIVDSYCFISRHHARLQLDSSMDCWLEDLRSLNGTAIFHSGHRARAQKMPYVERLVPGMRYRLWDGDILALGYQEHKDPYFVASYHKYGRW